MLLQQLLQGADRKECCELGLCIFTGAYSSCCCGSCRWCVQVLRVAGVSTWLQETETRIVAHLCNIIWICCNLCIRRPWYHCNLLLLDVHLTTQTRLPLNDNGLATITGDCLLKTDSSIPQSLQAHGSHIPARPPLFILDRLQLCAWL